MTPSQLKSSILQLAIQGKLVPQIPSEGTGEDLYKQIQKEKQALIKAGKIKKEKPLPPIDEDELPFEIPENWKWVRLGEIIYLNSGNQYDEVEHGIPYLKVADMNLPENRTEITTSTRFVSDENLGIIPRYSIIFPKRGGAIATNKKRIVKRCPVYIDSNTMGMSVYCTDIFEYVRLWFDSVDLSKLQTGTSVPQINNKDLIPLLFPLPPLAEQRRIVAKIESLLPLIDRYDKAWTRLEVLNKKFPGDLKKSLLQMAIQGKLVPQIPSEGTGEDLYKQIQKEKQALIKAGKIKKEKPLPPIDEDELPFEIPEGWKWCRMSEIIDVRDGTHDTPKYVLDGIPLVTSKNLIDGRIEFSTTKLISFEDAQNINQRSKVDSGDILFAMIGTIGNPVLVNIEQNFCIKNMALFKSINCNLFYMKYLLLFLQNEQYEMKKKANGGVQSFVSLGFLREYLIPLPPLAEQRRIVAKLDELLPLVDKLGIRN